MNDENKERIARRLAAAVLRGEAQKERAALARDALGRAAVLQELAPIAAFMEQATPGSAVPSGLMEGLVAGQAASQQTTAVVADLLEGVADFLEETAPGQLDHLPIGAVRVPCFDNGFPMVHVDDEDRTIHIHLSEDWRAFVNGAHTGLEIVTSEHRLRDADRVVAITLSTNEVEPPPELEGFPEPASLASD